jgi:Uma2 family endonuclease
MLSRLLANFVEDRRLGQVYHAPFDVTLAPQTRVQPDIVFIARERLHLVKETGLFGAPDLVVEILSESTWRVDKGEKLELYRRSGVQEYWIADSDQRTITAHRFAEPGEPRTLALDDNLASPLFPGLEIPLRAVFDY